MDNIFAHIKALVDYAEECGLIEKYDKCYCTNRVIKTLCLDEYIEPDEGAYLSLPERSAHLSRSQRLEAILTALNDHAFKKGIIKENTITERDLFDTELMGIFTPRPSFVIERFNSLAKEVTEIEVTMPWKRMFEIDIKLK